MSTLPSSSHDIPELAWSLPDRTWSIDEYVELTNSTNRLIELNNGRLEVLPMPTESHQFILRYLFLALHGFVDSLKLGEVLFCGLRVRTDVQSIREPDLVFMKSENRERRSDDFWTGADLAMEIVSPDLRSRKRDLKEKRAEYAGAGIPEYWIIEPEEKRITVLTLTDGQYIEYGVFCCGDVASSKLLEGFSVDVSEVFAAAEA